MNWSHTPHRWVSSQVHWLSTGKGRAEDFPLISRVCCCLHLFLRGKLSSADIRRICYFLGLLDTDLIFIFKDPDPNLFFCGCLCTALSVKINVNVPTASRYGNKQSNLNLITLFFVI